MAVRVDRTKEISRRRKPDDRLSILQCLLIRKKRVAGKIIMLNIDLEIALDQDDPLLSGNLPGDRSADGGDLKIEGQSPAADPGHNRSAFFLDRDQIRIIDGIRCRSRYRDCTLGFAVI